MLDVVLIMGIVGFIVALAFGCAFVVYNREYHQAYQADLAKKYYRRAGEIASLSPISSQQIKRAITFED